MELETILLAALQSSFLLGLLHGINPCGHSWLVLAPFITGEKNGGRVALLTCSFLIGTALACLVLGATLGTVSQFVPVHMGTWVEGTTSVVLIILGILLIYNPQLLHSHKHSHEQHVHVHTHDENHGFSQTHEHEHRNQDLPKHSHAHDHARPACHTMMQRLTTNNGWLPFALFGIGFVNMIVPCPTAAVMYGYAFNAGNTLTATLVFATYAFSTAIAVGGVIFLIFKATNMANSLRKDWVEPLIMRLSGVVIIVFSAYGLYQISA